MTTMRSVLLGVSVNEFRMQWRRTAMWFAMAVTGAFFLLVAWKTLDNRIAGTTARQAVAVWAGLLNVFTPIAYGIVLVDRLPRDRQLHVDELLESLPIRLESRVWGKAIGATVATILPFLVVATGGILYLSIHYRSASAIPLGLAALVTINLPGLLFTTAACVALSAAMWTPAARVLFAALWMWLQVPPFHVPSLSNSLLAPNGGYAMKGFFAAPRTVAGLGGLVTLGPLAPPATPAMGILSTLLIVALAVAILGISPMLVRRGADR